MARSSECGLNWASVPAVVSVNGSNFSGRQWGNMSIITSDPATPFWKFTKKRELGRYVEKQVQKGSSQYCF